MKFIWKDRGFRGPSYNVRGTAATACEYGAGIAF